MGIGNENFGRATTKFNSLSKKGKEVKRTGVRELEPDAEKFEREGKDLKDIAALPSRL